MSESTSSESSVSGFCLLRYQHMDLPALLVPSRNITNPAASIVASGKTASMKIVLLILSIKRSTKVMVFLSWEGYCYFLVVN